MRSKFVNWTTRVIKEEIVRLLFYPIATAIVVGVVGWLEGIQLFYWIIGILFAFACVTTGLVHFQNWIHLNKTEHKLAFHRMRIAAVSLDGHAVLRFGLELQSSAVFPMHFTIDDMKTSLTEHEEINGRAFYPPKKDYERKEFIIPPNGIGWFEDHNIEVPIDIRGTFSGQLQCRITYGKKDRLDCSFEVNKKTFFQFDDKGFSGGSDWYDQ